MYLLGTPATHVTLKRGPRRRPESQELARGRSYRLGELALALSQPGLGVSFLTSRCLLPGCPGSVDTLLPVSLRD